MIIWDDSIVFSFLLSSNSLHFWECETRIIEKRVFSLLFPHMPLIPIFNGIERLDDTTGLMKFTVSFENTIQGSWSWSWSDSENARDSTRDRDLSSANFVTVIGIGIGHGKNNRARDWERFWIRVRDCDRDQKHRSRSTLLFRLHRHSKKSAIIIILLHLVHFKQVPCAPYYLWNVECIWTDFSQKKDSFVGYADKIAYRNLSRR